MAKIKERYNAPKDENPYRAGRLSNLSGRAVAAAWKILHFFVVLALIPAIVWLAAWYLWWFMGAPEFRNEPWLPW